MNENNDIQIPVELLTLYLHILIRKHYNYDKMFFSSKQFHRYVSGLLQKDVWGEFRYIDGGFVVINPSNILKEDMNVIEDEYDLLDKWFKNMED